MIVGPPGEPVTSQGLPSLRTKVGTIVDNMRLPGAIALAGIGAPVALALSACSWLKLFIWLLSRKPRPSTITPEPKSAPRVKVLLTLLPAASATEKWVVFGLS